MPMSIPAAFFAVQVLQCVKTLAFLLSLGKEMQDKPLRELALRPRNENHNPDPVQSDH
jgi:hypothetical protein